MAPRSTTTYRFNRHLWLPALFGALVGLVGWLDQQLLGGHQAASAIATLEPAEGFLVNVIGAAVTFTLLWWVIYGTAWLHHFATVRHVKSCPVRYLHSECEPCSCPSPSSIEQARRADSRQWTPAERRQAWRTIQGGRQ